MSSPGRKGRAAARAWYTGLAHICAAARAQGRPGPQVRVAIYQLAVYWPRPTRLKPFLRLLISVWLTMVRKLAELV